MEKAEDENQNLSGEDTTPEPIEEKTPEDTKQSEAEIAKNNSQTLVSTPYDFWLKRATQSHTQKVVPILPIKVSLKIYGISGLMPGDLIRVNYLPKMYWLYSYFQITKVSQDIGNTWDTSLETQMRIAPMVRDAPKKEVFVGKSYLRNVLKLERIDSFIHTFGNLKPLDIPRSSNGDRLIYIDNIFECVAVGSLEGTLKKSFDLATLWSNKSVDDLEAV